MITGGGMSGPVVTEWHDGEVTVRPVGAVDLATAPALDAAIGAALAGDGATRLVVDLSEIGFLDSSGISSLLRGRRAAGDRGIGYQVVGANGIVHNVLEITGVWQLLSEPTG
jgi:anti-sigma B factor antagonist